MYAKRTDDSDYIVPEEPGMRTNIVKNHKERSKFGAEVSVLKSGDKFGDLCFYKSNKERNATVIAEENLHLLVVDCKVYQVLLADKFLDMKDQLRFMVTSPLFKGQSNPQACPTYTHKWQETLFVSKVFWCNA